jgi:hypothetical protein
VKCLLIPGTAVLHPSTPLLIRKLEPATGEPAVLDLTPLRMPVQLADMIEGPVIRLIPIAGEGWMCMNEAHGDQPENIVATALARQTGTLSMASYVTGPAVVVGNPDTEGIPSDVPGQVLAIVREMGCIVAA